MKSAIFVISMRTASARRELMAEELGRTNQDWSFFDAYDTLHPDLSYDPVDALSHHGRALREGEIGCYSSHYAVWKKILDDDLDQAIVLEDDVMVDLHAIASFQTTDISRIGIEYLRLFYKHPGPIRIKKVGFIMPERFLIQLTGRPAGTQGYMITRLGAKRFVRHFKSVKRPIDREMDRFWGHGVPNLSVFPFPIVERAVPSTIGSERYTPLKRSWRFKRNGIMEDFRRRLSVFGTRVRERSKRLSGR